MSQSLNDPSPEPDAKFFELGLNCIQRTASVWPNILLDALVIGFTLNVEIG